ncbi:MAG: O-antigen ligase family protein [Alphaproteobacteria bacterium]|nr:O-antigen ligase family protein [Alphaproteobacteria bacterium]
MSASLPHRGGLRSEPLVQPSGGVHAAILLGAGGFILIMGVAALYDPRFLTLFLAAGMALCLAVPVLRFPVFSSVAWLLVAGSSPEWWLADMIGNDGMITAAVKVVGLGLVVLCIVRYGGRFDMFNPAFAFVAMYIVGFIHGLYPTLTALDSTRSLIGSMAPYTFSFSRLSRRWCTAMINTTICIPTLIVVFGVVLAGAGIRPLFIELGGIRLEGSTHPAFLGGFAAAAIYAGLLELFRGGRSRYLWSIIVNYVILVLSGARAPLFLAFMVTLITFVALRSEQFPLRRRIMPVLAGMLLLPVLVSIALGGSSAIRLFDMLSSENDASNMSGRDILWPYFEAAWQASPTFGWGVGAARMVLDPDSLVVKLLGTTAAHNEYLRMGVEGGYVGIFTLVTLMALWGWSHTRGAPRADRFILRLVLIAFAIHSITDNTLIAGTASILFTWFSATFARIALEREDAAAEARRSRSEMAMAHDPRSGAQGGGEPAYVS